MTTKHDVHAALATLELAFVVVGEQAPEAFDAPFRDAVNDAFVSLRAFVERALETPSSCEDR